MKKLFDRIFRSRNEIYKPEPDEDDLKLEAWKRAGLSDRESQWLMDLSRYDPERDMLGWFQSLPPGAAELALDMKLRTTRHVEKVVAVAQTVFGPDLGAGGQDENDNIRFLKAHVVYAPSGAVDVALLRMSGADSSVSSRRNAFKALLDDCRQEASRDNVIRDISSGELRNPVSREVIQTALLNVGKAVKEGRSDVGSDVFTYVPPALLIAFARSEKFKDPFNIQDLDVSELEKMRPKGKTESSLDFAYDA